MKLVCQLLPDRTLTSIRGRRFRLNIPSTQKLWTVPALGRLTNALEAGGNIDDLQALFPERTRNSIHWALKYRGLRTRPGPEKRFHHPAVNEIKLRCWQKDISVRKMAIQAGINPGFGKTHRSTALCAIVKAVEWLGGEIDIVWEEPVD